MAGSRKVFHRLLRNRAVWLIAALAIGAFVGWAGVSASADAGKAGKPYPGRIVASAMAGADVLLPSSAIEPSTPLALADDG